jgi:hypothetical protein
MEHSFDLDHAVVGVAAAHIPMLLVAHRMRGLAMTRSPPAIPRNRRAPG